MESEWPPSIPENPCLILCHHMWVHHRVLSYDKWTLATSRANNTRKIVCKEIQCFYCKGCEHTSIISPNLPMSRPESQFTTIPFFLLEPVTYVKFVDNFTTTCSINEHISLNIYMASLIEFPSTPRTRTTWLGLSFTCFLHAHHVGLFIYVPCSLIRLANGSTYPT